MAAILKSIVIDLSTIMEVIYHRWRSRLLLLSLRTTEFRDRVEPTTRIVLSIEDKLNYLEQPIPPVPVAPAGQQVAPEILAAHIAWVKGSKEIAGLMLMTMEPEIQRNLEPLHAHEMLKELKTLFAHMGKTVNELHAMLKLHEQTLPKSNAHALNVIRVGKVQKEEDLEIDELQSDIVPIRRSTQTRHAPDCMCLYIDAEEHELGDLGEPANYKAALL
nr:hypothetical protein [Tanacetum cinerariifolium]